MLWQEIRGLDEPNRSRIRPIEETLPTAAGIAARPSPGSMKDTHLDRPTVTESPWWQFRRVNGTHQCDL